MTARSLGKPRKTFCEQTDASTEKKIRGSQGDGLLLVDRHQYTNTPMHQYSQAQLPRVRGIFAKKVAMSRPRLHERRREMIDGRLSRACGGDSLAAQSMAALAT